MLNGEQGCRKSRDARADSHFNMHARIQPVNRFDRSDLSPENGASLTTARTLYRNRRLRDEAFRGREIFGEPAWDLLLDLYIASYDRKVVSVTAACAASAVPVTTALRWLGLLERQELVDRSPDLNDRRRMLVSLTPKAVSLMESYLAHIAAGGAI